jgi:hypothetical protein
MEWFVKLQTKVCDIKETDNADRGTFFSSMLDPCMDGTRRVWRRVCHLHIRLHHLSPPPPPASIPAGGSKIPPDPSPGGYPRPDGDPQRCRAPNTIVVLVAAGQLEVTERVV